MGRLLIRYTLCQVGRHFTCAGCTCQCHETAETPAAPGGRYTALQADAAAWDLDCFFAPLRREKLVAALDMHRHLLVAA